MLVSITRIARTLCSCQYFVFQFIFPDRTSYTFLSLRFKPFSTLQQVQRRGGRWLYFRAVISWQIHHYLVLVGHGGAGHSQEQLLHLHFLVGGVSVCDWSGYCQSLMAFLLLGDLQNGLHFLSFFSFSPVTARSSASSFPLGERGGMGEGGLVVRSLPHPFITSPRLPSYNRSIAGPYC